MFWRRQQIRVIVSPCSTWTTISPSSPFLLLQARSSEVWLKCGETTGNPYLAFGKWFQPSLRPWQARLTKVFTARMIQFIHLNSLVTLGANLKRPWKWVVLYARGKYSSLLIPLFCVLTNICVNYVAAVSWDFPTLFLKLLGSPWPVRS